jgi:lipase ATG15
MVISVQYVEESWKGHPFAKQIMIGRITRIAAEWALLAIFFGIPLFCICVTLFLQLENWWEVTSLVWFICICISYVAFASAVVGIEINACFQLMRKKYNTGLESWFSLFRRCVLLRQRHVYGGTLTRTYLLKGELDHSFKADGALGCEVEESRRTHMSLYSRMIALKVLSTDGCLGLFRKLDEPKRLFSIEDIKNERPFVNADTWSLVGFFCKPSNARYISILKGPQALTKAQMQSSFVCALVGNILLVLLIVGLLTWLGLPVFGILILLAIVFTFGLFPGIKSTIRIFWMTKDVAFSLGIIKGENNEQLGNADESNEYLKEHETQGIFQVWETYRITTLTERMSWIIFSFELVFLFLLPISSFIWISNTLTGIIFAFISMFSLLRIYFSAATLLEEHGSLDLVEAERGTRKNWQNMSTLSFVLSKISRSHSINVWGAILSTFLVLFLCLFAMAASEHGGAESEFKFTFLPDFEYRQSHDLPYPTCNLGKGLSSLGSPTSEMSDFAFLAVLAYRDPKITQNQLDQWFGSGVAFDNQTFVDTYRNGIDNFKSAASFKLVSFPSLGNRGVVTIRGSVTAWDFLTDMQLWSAAALFQGLRAVLPLGTIWTPILYHMINAITWLASKSLDRVSFYRDITKFVLWLRENEFFDKIQITGHSLGGGKFFQRCV